MRVLVTGGAGFIGASFVRQTLATRPGIEVCVLDALRQPTRDTALADLRGRIELEVGDVSDARLVDRLVGGCDLVVHFAAESHNDTSLRDPAPFVQTNLVGAFTVLEAVRRHGVRLHHISTDEVFGSLDVGDPARFSERSPLDPSSPYSATKAGADLLVRAWVRSFGVAATISNCANNYGPYQQVEKFIPRQITNVLTGRRPRLYGTGEQVRDWIHVDDHNAAVWSIIERGRPGETYLIGADGERSNLDVVAMILELLGRPADEYDLVADRPGHDRRYAIDASKLRSELGWTPRWADLRAGIEHTITWYREHRTWWEPGKAAVEARYAGTGQ